MCVLSLSSWEENHFHPQVNIGYGLFNLEERRGK